MKPNLKAISVLALSILLVGSLLYSSTIQNPGLSSSQAGITALTGAVTAGPGSGSQAASIANDAVTTAKILNDAVTTAKILDANVTLAKIANAAANSKLLGSGAAGSGAPYAELTLGTNLSMSGTTLNAGAGGTLGGAALFRTTTQSINSAAFTAISFDSEEYDTDGYHEGVTNPTRLTVPATGVYLVTGSFGWSTASATGSQILIRSNGTNYLSNSAIPTGHVSNAGSMTTSRIVALSATDYVELIAWQNSGGALLVQTAANYTPVFQIERLR